MVPDTNAILLFRFGENRWIQPIIDGTLSFSCAESFVRQAMKTDNEIQGDRFEGVFARLKHGDTKISEMEKLLGNDLQKSVDGDYVLLRRRSAMLRPIYCLYGYKAIDLLHDGGDKIHVGENVIRHDFDPRMFSGFSGGDWNSNVVANDKRFAVLTLLPQPFVDRVTIAMACNKLSYRMGPIDYELEAAETFFIHPTSNYDELFCKRPAYAYQHEARICLKDIILSSYFQRVSIYIGRLLDNEYHKEHSPFYFNIETTLGRK